MQSHLSRTARSRQQHQALTQQRGGSWDTVNCTNWQDLCRFFFLPSSKNWNYLYVCKEKEEQFEVKNSEETKGAMTVGRHTHTHTVCAMAACLTAADTKWNRERARGWGVQRWEKGVSDKERSCTSESNEVKKKNHCISMIKAVEVEEKEDVLLSWLDWNRTRSRLTEWKVFQGWGSLWGSRKTQAQRGNDSCTLQPTSGQSWAKSSCECLTDVRWTTAVAAAVAGADFYAAGQLMTETRKTCFTTWVLYFHSGEIHLSNVITSMSV